MVFDFQFEFLENKNVRHSESSVNTDVCILELLLSPVLYRFNHRFGNGVRPSDLPEAYAFDFAERLSSSLHSHFIPHTVEIQYVQLTQT